MKKTFIIKYEINVPEMLNANYYKYLGDKQAKKEIEKLLINATPEMLKPEITIMIQD